MNCTFICVDSTVLVIEVCVLASYLERHAVEPVRIVICKRALVLRDFAKIESPSHPLAHEQLPVLI